MSDEPGEQPLTKPPDSGLRVPANGPSTALLVAGVVAVAVNLRAPITSVPALIATIQDDLGLSGAAAGALTTLPLVCMGVFAPPAGRLAARIGRETAITVALGCILVGLLLRLAGSVIPLLYLSVIIAGAGIAIGGTVLPGIVKEFFAARAGTMTGVYMASMMLGATIAAALAVPLADAFGSWEKSLASWSVLATIGLAVWINVQRRVPEHKASPSHVRLPWRDRTAWIVAAYLSLNSFVFYSLLAWLAPLFEDRGVSATEAGLLLATLNLVQLAAALTVPAIADLRADRRPVFGVVVAATAVGLAWLALAPDFGSFVLVGLLGFGLGAGFTLGLVLLVDYAPDPAASARLSALAFLVSYLVAALGPLISGVLRDSTDGFGAMEVLLLVVGVTQLLLVPALRPGRLVH